MLRQALCFLNCITPNETDSTKRKKNLRIPKNNAGSQRAIKVFKQLSWRGNLLRSAGGCHQRFTNFAYTGTTPLQLFSTTGSPFTLPIPTACIGINPRKANPQIDYADIGSIKVWPIPVINSLFITNIVLGSDILLYDLYGNLITKILSTHPSVELDISNLASGIYFISSGLKKPIKIIKMHATDY